MAPIAIFLLAVLLATYFYKTVKKLKGDEATENRKKVFISASLDILSTMSANLAGGALLAKTLQL